MVLDIKNYVNAIDGAVQQAEIVDVVVVDVAQYKNHDYEND